MDTGLIVVIVLIVLAVLVAAAFLASRARQRRQEQHRLEAAEHRNEAEIRNASAQRREAESAERAARARHEQAQAQEQAARAQRDREVAETRTAAADRVDPDTHRDRSHAGHDTDQAARTDDMHLGARGTGASDGSGPGHPQHGGRDGDEATRHGETVPGGGRHHDTRAPQATGDPAARTDDLRMAGGQQSTPQGHHQAADDGAHATDPRAHTTGAQPTTSGWHGPTASGGGPAVTPASQRSADPAATRAGSTAPPAAGQGEFGGPGNQGQQGYQGYQDQQGYQGQQGQAGGTGDGAPPTAPNAAVPSQRTGEHEHRGRDGDAPEHKAHDEHAGPVRTLADRLLRRNG